jgi:hypothetical protein
MARKNQDGRRGQKRKHVALNLAKKIGNYKKGYKVEREGASLCRNTTLDHQHYMI